MITEYPRDFTRPLAQIPKEKLPQQKDIEPDGMEIFQGLTPGLYRERLEQLESHKAAEVFTTICEIAEDIKASGGRALLVGGSVRDEVLGAISKDFDIEVYNMDLEAIELALARFGKVIKVGKAFGVLTVSTGKGFNIDVSFPRKDSQVGDGHNEVEVKIDPGMSIKEAAKRRDFTFNALCKDPLTGEIFDGYGGVEDLRTRTLRVTDEERFQDDALRLLRGAQFSARFGLRVENNTRNLMNSMVHKIEHLAKERINTEWDKLLTKSIKPSIGLQLLRDMGMVEKYYPELAALETTPQEFEWHPEGDVWIHTLMVVDEAANLIKHYEREYQLDDDTRSTIMFAALCHDLGKPATTTKEDERIKSKGHEPAGEDPTRKLLEKIGVKKDIIERVVKIVAQHLWPGISYLQHMKHETFKKTNPTEKNPFDDITDGAFRKLAKRIQPANILELTIASEADGLGRGPFLDPNTPEQFMLLLTGQTYNAGNWVRRRAQELGVEKKPALPPIQGRDLLPLGLEAGHGLNDIMKISELLHNECSMSATDILLIIGAYVTDPSMEGKRGNEKRAIVLSSLTAYYERKKIEG